jgi:endonuclease III-like uncharacterized protein
MTILKEKLRCRYSGKNSEQFWKKINNLPESKKDEIYLAAVILQNTEDSVLKALNNAIQENSRRPCPFCGNTDLIVSCVDKKIFIWCRKCESRFETTFEIWNKRGGSI